ncbi:hypothetical protein TVAG_389820 [Trichomonas vaginalis G3]|uniref:Leucine Rich Repeat family protein n=1 Tax=Trichomonas vaginalis (strain ATCC PRA-98 / G3) TaxID=412133 RepID=A2E184_TRIV3|nr:leucine-rich repeat, isoform f-related family [Trichomonas vaginalis G3]EAY13585.1 hypothetical protein TVAG_389820 [Trichomonas vaginalis G3]KAI5486413.1 leucine-rich repeat, isoform f-related family [Trichomonas vaginalis G3]|eukprot:XP_001325808.1 hypothetical protein [Trichomonas vaginalis G3]
MLKFTHPSDDIIDLSFEKGQITFEHPSAKNLAIILAKFARSILTKEELPVININEDDPEGFTGTKLCALRRFRALMFSEAFELKPSYIKVFADYLKTDSHTFDCTEFQNFQAIDRFAIQALEVDTTLEKIIIPPSGEHTNWKFVSSLLAHSQNLKSIVTSEKFDETAISLYEAFRSNQYCALSELVFRNNEIRDSYIHILDKIVDAISLTSLTLSKSMSRRVLKIFLTSVESSENFNMIRNLVIDGFPEMYILTSTQVCKNIINLSFTNCETEVITVIKSLLKLVDCKIEKLDISGNLCLTNVSKAAKFPSSIKEVVMNDIKMDVSFIPNILTVVNNSKHPMTLHLSRIINSSDTWGSAFDRIASVECPELEGLYWDSNPINGQFLKFLESRRDLRLFSFSGYTNDDQSLNDVCDFISINETIETLIIKGTPKSMPKEVAMQIYRAISNNRSIKSLDLSSQQFDGELLDALDTALMNNRVVQCINIDYTSIQAEDLIKFLKQLKKRGIALKIIYDTSVFFPQGKHEEIAALIRKIGSGDSSIEVPQETVKLIPSDRAPKYRSIVVNIPAPTSNPQSRELMISKELEEPEEEEEYSYSYSSTYSEGEGDDKELPSLLCSVFDAIPPPPPDHCYEDMQTHYHINEIVARVRANDK